MHKEEKISLVLPAYNEGENLNNLIENIYKTINKNKLEKSFEVIIVNDGSEDNTEDVSNDLLKKYINLSLINLKYNSGKAYALDVGIQNASGEIIAIMDADMQYSPDNLIDMINLIHNGNDLVNGKRAMRKDNFVSIFFSKIFNFILRCSCGIKLHDFFSGIKIYRKEIYNLMDYSGMARFIIFFSNKYNYNICEIPVDHFYRKKGKTAYNFIDKLILSMKDIFSLIVCVYLEKKGVYQIKQSILLLYFFLFIILIFAKIFFNNFSNEYLYYTVSSFFMFSVLNLIIQSFLTSKEKKSSNLIKNIKSIKKTQFK